ncbi:hypothetical protein [Candidatus Burkholderia verschuerenii]|uniref:hypothetical protein n=1 Tax=Candidatus Burkholderia verschuerenii TaxID=242163 RepID=UPI00351A56C4
MASGRAIAHAWLYPRDQPFGRQRHRHDHIRRQQTAVLERRMQMPRERRARREPAAKLQFDGERIERRAIVGQRQRVVERGRIIQAIGAMQADIVARASRLFDVERHRAGRAAQTRLVPDLRIAAIAQHFLRHIAAYAH